MPGPNINFVPVGPWNTDGLIIVPDELTREQSEYVRDLLRSGFPMIFTTPEGPGPVVAVDNTLGIRRAFEHLLQHGHKRIAFIAGNVGHGGDSEERLQAYRLAVREAGLAEHQDLIAYGEHRRSGGKWAMQKIIASGADFSAVRAVPNGRGLGIFYWDATWTGVPGNGWDPADPSSGNAWENQALFDFNDMPVPALNEFKH